MQRSPISIFEGETTMTTTPPTGGSTPPTTPAPATPVPAPAPTAPAPAPAAPAAPTAPAPAAPATATPATTPPPPPAPPEEDGDEIYGWPTWAIVVTSMLGTLLTVGLLLWVLGAFSIQVHLGQIQPEQNVVVTATAVPEATAIAEATAVPEATAIAEATAVPEATATAEATAVPATAVPTAVPATAVPPTAIPVQPTAIPVQPTAIPPTSVPPTAIPVQPTAVPPFSYNSYEAGSTTVPVDSVCWGDLVAFNGTSYGDGTGPSNPVYAVVPAGTTVGLIWGACSNEPWEAVSARLASDPSTKDKVFEKKP